MDIKKVILKMAELAEAEEEKLKGNKQYKQGYHDARVLIYASIARSILNMYV